MKGLWKYAILGLAGRIVLMVQVNIGLSGLYLIPLGLVLFLVVVFWGYRDITRYKARRQLEKQLASEGGK